MVQTKGEAMNLDTNRHLDESEIEKYSMRDVLEPELSRYEEHLLICESCQDRVAASDEYVASMRDASSRIRQSDAASRPGPWHMPRPILLLAIAASLLLVVFLGFGGKGAGLFGGSAGSPAVVNMIAVRGNDVESQAPAGTALALNLNVEGLSPAASYDVEIVEEGGKSMWRGSAHAKGAIAAANAPSMTPGHYFLRAYSPEGKLLREYGLRVQAN